MANNLGLIIELKDTKLLSDFSSLLVWREKLPFDFLNKLFFYFYFYLVLRMIWVLGLVWDLKEIFLKSC